MKSKNTRKEKPYSRRISATLVGAYGFLTVGTVGLLAFLSPHVAFLASGLGAICLILYFDQRWRGFWEQAMGFQILSLKEEQDKMAAQMVQNQRDVERLTQSISKIDSQKRDVDEVNEADIVQLPASALIKNTAKPVTQKALKKKLRTITTKPRSLKSSRSSVAHKTNKADKKVVPKTKSVPQKSISYHALTRTEDVAQDVTAMRSPFRSRGRVVSPVGKPPPTYFHSAAGEEPQYTDTVIRNLVRSAVQNRDLAMFVQPVMSMPQRKTRFYELFARVRAGAGNYIPAAQFMGLAQADNIDHEIDNLLLIECLKVIQASAHIQRATPFFVNITGATLGNAVFMQRLVGFISKNRGLASRLIFEIPHEDYKDLNSNLLKVMQGLGQIGCRFAIGHAQNMAFDVVELVARKVRYIKMDKDVLLAQIETNQGLSKAVQVKRKLEGNGIGVIAEKIENEADVRSLLDLDLNFAQGYLFGRPDVQGAYTDTAKSKAA